MSIQDKLQKASANLQRKYQDIHLNHLGTSVPLLSITLEEDKWGNREFELTNNGIITGYISFPNNEIPITDLSGSNSDSAGKGFHLYDILPIEAYLKFSDNIKLQDFLLMKVETKQDTFKVAILQVTDRIAKFSSVSNVWQKYILSPSTFTTDLYPEIIELFNQYKTEEWLPEYKNGEWST